jgi:hypothetical protein
MSSCPPRLKPQFKKEVQETRKKFDRELRQRTLIAKEEFLASGLFGLPAGYPDRHC